jgi:hypothetical protein
VSRFGLRCPMSLLIRFSSMFNSIHKDGRTLQSEQPPVSPHAEAIFVIARGEFIDVTREAVLQGVEPLTDVAPQRFRRDPQLLASFLADEEAVTRT